MAAANPFFEQRTVTVSRETFVETQIRENLDLARYSTDDVLRNMDLIAYRRDFNGRVGGPWEFIQDLMKDSGKFEYIFY